MCNLKYNCENNFFKQILIQLCKCSCCVILGGCTLVLHRRKVTGLSPCPENIHRFDYSQYLNSFLHIYNIQLRLR